MLSAHLNETYAVKQVITSTDIKIIFNWHCATLENVRSFRYPNSISLHNPPSPEACTGFNILKESEKMDVQT